MYFSTSSTPSRFGSHYFHCIDFEDSEDIANVVCRNNDVKKLKLKRTLRHEVCDNVLELQNIAE